MNRLITITEDRLNKAKTPKGGYCKAQFQALGIEWPAKKGWRHDIIGKKITLRRFIAFVIAGKNKLYLEEIEGLLPTLTPPVTDLGHKPLLTAVEKKSSPQKIRRSKKELKKEKKSAKLAERTALREQKIREYGIHKSAHLIIEKSTTSINFIDIKFINYLLSKDELFIERTDVHSLYNLMKKYGIILSYRKGGRISASSHSKISTVWKEQLLYVIRDNESNHCKIGISKDPRSRIRALQTSNAKKLTISMVFDTKEDARKLEKSLHKNFQKLRKNGEWFEGVSDEKIVRIIGNRAKLTNDY